MEPPLTEQNKLIHKCRKRLSNALLTYGYTGAHVRRNTWRNKTLHRPRLAHGTNRAHGALYNIDYNSETSTV